MTTGMELIKSDSVVREILKKLPTNSTNSSNNQSEVEVEILPWDKVFASQKTGNKILPKNWQTKHFDTMVVDSGSFLERLILILKQRTLEDRDGIWFYGETGHGKSHLLTALFNWISWQYYFKNQGLHGKVRYWNYSDLCGVLRQDPNNFDLLQEIRSVDYLFIDDIGISKSTDFIQEKIYQIFNYRVENDLPTFVTTNMSIEDIKKEFTERMSSRIKESSAWIQLKGTKDFRSNMFLKTMEKYKGLK